MPVPPAAMACVDVREWHAVLDLYQRGFALHWGRFEVTERALCTRWGLGNRRVRCILHALRDAGLLRLTPGSQRTPSVIQIFDPVQHKLQASPAVIAESAPQISAVQHGHQHNSEPVTPVIQLPGAQPAATLRKKKTKTDVYYNGSAPPLPLPPRLLAGGRDLPGKAAWDELVPDYPWTRADLSRAREWGPHVQGAPERFAAAVRAYVGAVAAGRSYPAGEPPSVHWFTLQLSRWLQKTRPVPLAATTTDPRAAALLELGDLYHLTPEADREPLLQEVSAEIAARCLTAGSHPR